MSSSAASTPLQFAPFASHVSPSFWTALAAVKIDRLQLSDDVVALEARYTLGKHVVDRSTGNAVHMPPSMTLDDGSLDVQSSSSSSSKRGGVHVCVTGTLKNFNTVEDFKKADKPALLQHAGQQLLRAIQSDDDPTSKLTHCLLLSYADLKKYKFIYWFAFPALVAQPAWHVLTPRGTSVPWRPAQEVFDDKLLSIIANAVPVSAQHGFLLVRPDGRTAGVMQYDDFFDGVDSNERTVVFVDPSSLPDAPGWPLRNLLALLAVRFKVDRVRVLCWRDDVGGTGERSMVGTVATKRDDAAAATVVLDGVHLPFTPLSASSPTQPSVVGWERNAAGKLAPKMADLGPLMDPSRLADQAVDLNLKLMRWRILPEINLEKVQATRCLLLGAGTLGCYVARTLLGWGVRHITLVDSSTVSFSNPVRQPLFTFDDCLEGGKPKAERAAHALRSIYPGVRSQGVQLNIPMPGHPIPATSVEQVAKNVAQLEEMFDAHDVVYLLMDSRESRWLPTVLGAVKGKMVLNAALGFDTFLAMRHGASPTQHAQQSPPVSSRLGCYFCNDVVAPTDSLTDRTLDQMCTVSRPGLAAVASALTVEMMVSLLQHPLGTLAPAYNAAAASEAQPGSASILGHLPHQLRGSLFSFQNMLIHGPAYDRCTACSQTVMDAYVEQPFEMVQRACNDEAYLRTLTGLDKLYDATDDVEVDWSEEEGEEDDV